MESDIQNCFRSKTIFLTGATGFLGKVVIEKILRTTEVKRIYVLVRPKRGVDIQERMAAWSKDPIFGVLLKSKPEALQRISPIFGDCRDSNLGIREIDRRLLAAEVQIVIHGAATVRFNEPLHVALAINTRATRSMIHLAKEMKQLEVFLHISTAFSNCVLLHVEEKFYPEHLTCTSDKVLAISEMVSDEVLDQMEPALVGQFPNTYTYTKALAEDIILREACDLPVCIFRPAIIIATHKEPVTGWIDNMYGPIAILYGVAKGVLRVALINKDAQASLVPVDYCANLTIACAWKTIDENQKGRRQKETPIYQLSVDDGNKLSHGDFIEYALDGRQQCPLTRTLWYPFIVCLSSPRFFPIATFFLHTIPGYFIDIVLRLRGRKPRLLNIYRRVHKMLSVLGPFSKNSWVFDMRNTDHLRELMSEEDRRMYAFDMDRLDWQAYFRNALLGMRLYLGKEAPTALSLSQGLQLSERLKIIHYSLMILLCWVAGFILFWLMKLIVKF
ncbi:fatty acyl-CoA reductase wat isoform X1 [Drosophila bipectinata]|uniref:fatty acyl-CoA reductase wat isoform X1 n=1 Tax=Drosophila bipectinata TaxID=42026 RepID=UPI001C8AAE48|nr:fatty acyl-CoA reductase wat isoform X1 [Drosophila bipectinata]